MGEVWFGSTAMGITVMIEWDRCNRGFLLIVGEAARAPGWLTSSDGDPGWWTEFEGTANDDST